MTKRILRSVFPNRDVALLFAGQTASQMGDSVYQIGLMWLVLELTGSKSALGFVAMISYLPMLVFGLFAGIIVDLFDRRRVMLVSDLLRAASVVVIPVAFLAESLNLAILVIVSFLIASLSTAFNPARDAMIPGLVHPEQLIKTNALIQVSSNMAILAGPALGAALIGIFGVIHLFSLDSVTFLLSFAAILMIRRLPDTASPRNVGPGLIGHLKEIVKFIHHQRKLRILLGLTAVNNFFIMGPAIVGPPVFVRDILNGEAVSYALVESSLGLGMIIGSVLVNYISRRCNKGRILLIGMMFDGATHALVYYAGSLEVFMVLIGIHAVGIPWIVVARTALIQEWTESDKLGRVFSLVNVAVVGVTAVTTAFTGWCADWIGIDVIFGVFGLLGMLCGFLGWSFRDLRTS